MKAAGFTKGLPEAIAREVVIVLGGALVAAAIIGQLPTLRDWLKKQWDGAPRL